MDAKSLRAAMKEKAKRLASSSSEKVDSSTFTPAEPMNADVKTGMRPISRRAFKAGGKVEGGENARRADRTPRGFQELQFTEGRRYIVRANNSAGRGIAAPACVHIPGSSYLPIEALEL